MTGGVRPCPVATISTRPGLMFVLLAPAVYSAGAQAYTAAQVGPGNTIIQDSVEELIVPAGANSGKPGAVEFRAVGILRVDPDIIIAGNSHVAEPVTEEDEEDDLDMGMKPVKAPPCILDDDDSDESDFNVSGNPADWQTDSGEVFNPLDDDDFIPGAVTAPCIPLPESLDELEDRRDDPDIPDA